MCETNCARRSVPLRFGVFSSSEDETANERRSSGTSLAINRSPAPPPAERAQRPPQVPADADRERSPGTGPLQIGCGAGSGCTRSLASPELNVSKRPVPGKITWAGNPLLRLSIHSAALARLSQKTLWTSASRMPSWTPRWKDRLRTTRTTIAPWRIDNRSACASGWFRQWLC